MAPRWYRNSKVAALKKLGFTEETPPADKPAASEKPARKRSTTAKPTDKHEAGE